MSINLVISEICCNFKELIYKQLQAKTSMITEDKVTEIFCMVDDFCKFFDAMTTKYTLKPTGKRKYHRSSTMSKAEVMLIMILFHDSGYRCFKHFYLETAFLSGVYNHVRISNNPQRVLLVEKSNSVGSYPHSLSRFLNYTDKIRLLIRSLKLM